LTANLQASSQSLSQSFDVLLVGSGAAGLYAALCIPDTYRVGLITKDVLTQSASDWAQGGIAAAIAPEDSPSLHQTDTLQAGAGLCDPTAVAQLVDSAQPCIDALVAMGVPFDRQGDRLALTLEAAHSRKRVLHAADTTGRAVVATLAATVRQRPHITVLEHTFVLDLWHEAGTCHGVMALQTDPAQGESICWIAAGAVVLATGGRRPGLCGNHQPRRQYWRWGGHRLAGGGATAGFGILSISPHRPQGGGSPPLSNQRSGAGGRGSPRRSRGLSLCL
jgi:L-aspartate oxidase